jgi:hypothetical protein
MTRGTSTIYRRANFDDSNRDPFRPVATGRFEARVNHHIGVARKKSMPPTKRHERHGGHQQSKLAGSARMLSPAVTIAACPYASALDERFSTLLNGR